MSDWYIVRPGGVIEKPDNWLDGAKWFGTHANVAFMDGGRRVALTDLGDGVSISTVFLGMDHRFGDGPPVLFETLVMGGPRDGDMDRYCTHAEAVAGHERIVSELTAADTPTVVQ